MEKRIKVLVVDDSAFMRRVLTDIMEGTGEIKVIGTARNGIEALDFVRSNKPDVITLDVEMPSMDGLSCLKELQKFSTVPVIMLSGLTKKGEQATIEALEAGAIDFITKPEGLFQISGEEKKKEIIEKIKVAGRIGKKKHKIRQAEPEIPVEHIEYKGRRDSKLRMLIAIGTSTGGPRALQEVISHIPGDIPAALVIVQHMPAGFTRSLAERLNSISSLTVKEGEHGDIIQPGYAYIAPGDFHMEVDRVSDEQLEIKLTKEPPVGAHRPSVNVMMNSVAKTGFPNVIGVVMTGMGNDGKEGVVNIKKSNKGIIIAQDEESCVVYGMPKSAVGTGVVDAILPLKEIAGALVKYTGVERIWT